MKGTCGYVGAIRLLVVTVVYFSTYTSAENLTYACYPNATLKVENPGDFTMVFANNSVRVCNTTWAAGNQLLFIDNCGMDDNIFLSFSYLPNEYFHVIGGLNSSSYSINCAQITSSGEFKTINASMVVSIENLELTTYPSFDPEFKIHSGIYDDFRGETIANYTNIGDPLFWIMTSSVCKYWEGGPIFLLLTASSKAKYLVRPDECWAYAGKEIIDTVPKKRILLGGCTVDESLITNFMMYTYSKHLYGRRSILYAFRFYGSEYVTMECKVRVCEFNAIDGIMAFCESNDCTKRKKREFLDAEDDIKAVTVRSQFRVLSPSSGSSRFGEHTLWLMVLWIVHVL